MVIGNGMIAKKFFNYVNNDQFIIFASGVSNSKSRDQSEYQREFNLLKQYIKASNEHVFVYFSTASTYDPSESASEYIQHKMNIESYIQSSVQSYTIIRVSNLVGKSSNPNTVLNFFVNHIINGVNFDLWLNAFRNLLDVDDFYEIANHVLQRNLFLNKIVNIANPVNYSATEIVQRVELFYNKKASYIPIVKGDDFTIDISEVLPVIKNLKIDFNNYLDKLLLKYY